MDLWIIFFLTHFNVVSPSDFLPFSSRISLWSKWIRNYVGFADEETKAQWDSMSLQRPTENQPQTSSKPHHGRAGALLRFSLLARLRRATAPAALVLRGREDGFSLMITISHSQVSYLQIGPLPKCTVTPKSILPALSLTSQEHAQTRKTVESPCAHIPSGGPTRWQTLHLFLSGVRLETASF